jgi:DNA-binding NtrC family response regulator
MVYGAVTGCEGFVEVRSELGQGTCFEIYLPVAPHSATGSATQAKLQLTGRETVLLVEDDEDVRGFAKLALGNQGYELLCAADGPAALELVDKYEGHIDLLVSDLIMPDMSGRELAEALKRSRGNIKVLFMSGYTDDKILIDSVEQRQSNFLQKPFSTKELNGAVRRVLDGA